LQNPSDWQIRVVGLVKRRQIITLPALQPHVRPAGTHVMECSGNASGGHFGLLSAAEWSGVPLGRIIPSLGPLPAARRVLISGFDEYPQPSRHRSVPGAGWIFTPEQLRSTGAFLATKMNGQPLTPDHGAPVRLIVPGWYGCTCIKWVDRIELVADDAPATSQMLEFAARTHQEGVPELARDYLPAALEQAAMALRVDPVQGRRSPTFRITGVTWGGKCVTQGLQIRFRADEEYRPVAPAAAPKQPTSWALWTYDWQPTGAGLYAIQLRIDPPKVPQRRLDAGYYTRYVEL
jgi:DMSO/TMAO reductase YedYZ molybdopterin-dependent catalytic subunit